jgi:hypothetical protein
VLQASPWNHDLTVFLTGRSLNGFFGHHELPLQEVLVAQPLITTTKLKQAASDRIFWGAFFIVSSSKSKFGFV